MLKTDNLRGIPGKWPLSRDSSSACQKSCMGFDIFAACFKNKCFNCTRGRYDDNLFKYFRLISNLDWLLKVYSLWHLELHLQKPFVQTRRQQLWLSSKKFWNVGKRKSFRKIFVAWIINLSKCVNWKSLQRLDVNLFRTSCLFVIKEQLYFR